MEEAVVDGTGIRVGPGADGRDVQAFMSCVNRRSDVQVPLEDYESLHAWSIQNTSQFWGDYLSFSGLRVHPPCNGSLLEKAVLVSGSDASGKPALVNAEWFPGRRICIAENILLTTNPDQAICSYHEVDCDNGASARLTMADIKGQVGRLARHMQRHGVRTGDVVAAVVANEPVAVIAFLAANSLGAIFTSCSPEFGLIATLDRVAQTSPKVLVFCADGGYWYKGRWVDTHSKTRDIAAALTSAKIRLGYRSCGPSAPPEAVAIDTAYTPMESVINTTGDNDCDLEFTPVGFNEPVLILYTSGTSGTPKAIVHGPGVFLNNMKESHLHFRISSQTKLLQYTSTSWMMWNWMVATMAAGASLILYEGHAVPPNDPFRLVKIMHRENATHFGTSPGYVRAIQRLSHSLDKVPVPRLRGITVTGSPSTAEDFAFVAMFFGDDIPFMSISGGTDICGSFLVACAGLVPIVPGRLSVPSLGFDVCSVDDQGHRLLDSSGELVCRSQAPVYPLRFLNDEGHKRYRGTYFDKLGEHTWCHGDELKEHSTAAGGGFTIIGRSDMTLNVNGVRMGSSELYRASATLSWIEDSCVVAQQHGEDQRIVMVVVSPSGLTKERANELRSHVRASLSPRHVPHLVIEAPSGIPYTFSGKKAEAAVKRVLEGKEVPGRSSLRNPEALSAIRRSYESAMASE